MVNHLAQMLAVRTGDTFNFIQNENTDKNQLAIEMRGKLEKGSRRVNTDTWFIRNENGLIIFRESQVSLFSGNVIRVNNK